MSWAPSITDVLICWPADPQSYRRNENEVLGCRTWNALAVRCWWATSSLDQGPMRNRTLPDSVPGAALLLPADGAGLPHAATTEATAPGARPSASNRTTNVRREIPPLRYDSAKSFVWRSL